MTFRNMTLDFILNIKLENFPHNMYGLLDKWTKFMLFSMNICMENPVTFALYFWSKESNICMKPSNMGIKSCVLMPLKLSWRVKIKISPVFSIMAKKVSKMGEMWDFEHFRHLLGSGTKHRQYFDFISSGCV